MSIEIRYRILDTESRACDLYTSRNLFELCRELKGKELKRAERGALAFARMIGKERLNELDELAASKLAIVWRTDPRAFLEWTENGTAENPHMVLTVVTSCKVETVFTEDGTHAGTVDYRVSASPEVGSHSAPVDPVQTSAMDDPGVRAVVESCEASGTSVAIIETEEDWEAQKPCKPELPTVAEVIKATEGRGIGTGANRKPEPAPVKEEGEPKEGVKVEKPSLKSALSVALLAGAKVERTSAAWWVYLDPSDERTRQALKEARFYFAKTRSGWYFSSPVPGLARHEIKSLEEVEA